MKFKIFSDIHRYSPIEIPHEDMFAPQENYIYLGDNIDLKNVKKKLVPEARADIERLKRLYGSRFCSGNHELSNIIERYFTETENGSVVLFTHSDDLFWSLQKSMKYRAKKPGAGWFKRKVIVPLIHAARPHTTNRLKEKAKERMYNLMVQYGADTLVVGHKHPNELMRIKYMGKEIIIVPRGITELYL